MEVEQQGVVFYIKYMTEKEKQLIDTYAEQAFHGRLFRQHFPVCDCGKVFDEKELYNAPGVFLRKVDVFGKTYTMIEPICPVCKKRIPGSYSILN